MSGSTLERLRGASRKSDRKKTPPENVVGASELDPTSFAPACQGDWRTPTPAVLKASQSGKLPAAAPCPTCGSPIFWLDPAGRVHCGECRRPPSHAIQRGDLHVITLPGGSLAWLHEHPDLLASDRDEGDRDGQAEQLPPDVRPPQVSIDEIESAECDPPAPCQQCGRIDFWWNFFGEQRCLRCAPPRPRLRSQLTAGRLSGELRERAERSPATQVWRRQRAEKLAEEAKRMAAMMSEHKPE